MVNTKRDAQVNWFCVICEESFKEDMVQCSRCLRWEHTKWPNDPGATYVYFITAFVPMLGYMMFMDIGCSAAFIFIWT